ncbi:hypothetical protein SMACR_07957 [Sordaria macrospora]|uniref:WGS project CABT00000000 data, contig 2.48 n=2 Tax=Sordaria macrospora TaxID=5147 RepID=F7W907_SORMK|nr:uncharacterized protein SMAC_07957 [Sordaria macrospora k-hell]KAA8631961.1 hypothetical protein SMACR_07957 [Sordaria macrospora]WPJ61138.1 hypothetical protein SMAC4_07957 [Sordaria macrospora]CCC13888.1 unnamed protein product [Sordaria macrospora k-hell]
MALSDHWMYSRLQIAQGARQSFYSKYLQSLHRSSKLDLTVDPHLCPLLLLHHPNANFLFSSNQPEHKGANLHDLRNGQFRAISYAGNGPPRIVVRSNKPPTPILPFLPPSSPASSVVRSSSVERGPTPAIYIKSEHPIVYEDGQQAELIVLDSEDDEHTSSTRDVGEVVEEEEKNSDEDMDDVFSDGAGADKESVTSVSDAEEEDVAVHTPDRNGLAFENLENGQFFNYAASPVWRHINRFTPSRIPVPEDTCLREFLTLPLARELPHCWHVLLAQPRFATEYFNLKMMTGVAMFLTGEEMDVAACTTFDKCLFQNPIQVARALSDFAAKGNAVHNIFAFPRCVVPSADFLERSATLKERLGGITCCNAYFHLGKVPEPKLIYVAGYPLPYPITPENPPRAAPAPARKDNGASPTSGQLQQSSPYNDLPQSSPLKSRSTSESLKRKIPPCAASDDYLHSYRLSADPVTPAKWESVNGVLRQRDSHLAPVFAYSPSYVSHHSSSDYSHKQANKRIKLLSSPSSDGSRRGTTIADFRIIHLHRLHKTSGTSNTDDDLKPKTAQSVSLPVSESHAFVCSVASGGPVRVFLDKCKGGGQERPFDIMDGGVWIVEKGWNCRMEVAVSAANDAATDVDMENRMQVTASVHVTGVLASETGKENKNKQERKQERKEKMEQKKQEKKMKKAIKEQQKQKKEQAKKIKEESKKENLARKQAKQAKQERRKQRVIKREKKHVKNEKNEKKEKRKD